MKYRIKFTTVYKRSYKLAKKRGLNINLLNDIVELLGNGEPLAPKHHDHALHGNFEGFRECHIQPDWLLVYFIENDILTLTLTDTRTHADIFGK